MPSRDLPEEIWVIEPFKSHEAKRGGFAIGKLALKGDADVKRRYRRKLEKRIRSINERRLADLAESAPNAALRVELEDAQERYERLLERNARLREQLKNPVD